MMAEEFVLVVDDYSWQDVRRGTQDGVFFSNLTTIYEQVLWDGLKDDYGGTWWNGVYIGLLKRSK